MGVIGCIPMPRAGSLEAVRVRRRCRAFFSSTFCPFFFPFPSTDCHGLRKWREFVEVQWNWEDLGQKGGREAFMGKRIVVLGGGTAGTMVANRLARRLMDSIRSGELEILLITRSGRHVYQPGLLSVVFSEAFPEQIVREEKSLPPCHSYLLPACQAYLLCAGGCRGRPAQGRRLLPRSE